MDNRLARKKVGLADAARLLMRTPRGSLYYMLRMIALLACCACLGACGTMHDIAQQRAQRQAVRAVKKLERIRQEFPEAYQVSYQTEPATIRATQRLYQYEQSISPLAPIKPVKDTLRLQISTPYGLQDIHMPFELSNALSDSILHTALNVDTAAIDTQLHRTEYEAQQPVKKGFFGRIIDHSYTLLIGIVLGVFFLILFLLFFRR